VYQNHSVSDHVPEVNGVSTSGHLPHLKSLNPDMRLLLARLERVANAEATVLITGESGTGKGVLAEAVHRLSPRQSGPFVALNCAALPEGLLESELFGHEKGAFTGAARQRVGRFELAQGGTLFLDEVGTAPAKVQLRLLRVLQERSFERVGGEQTLAADVRVVAATNADLRAEVDKGCFREDLYYRLNVVALQVPPLRRRLEDLPDLAGRMVLRAAKRNRRPIRGWTPETLKILGTYPWPGNVRQLENAIESMVVLADGSVLRPQDVPEEIRFWRLESDPSEENIPLREAKMRFERRFLRRSLKRHRGVISQVAESLGMSRKNLYTKLESLEIDYNTYRV
jgi:two-component system, NtrC family, response regulator HydG